MRNSHYTRYLATSCFLLMLSTSIAETWAQTMNYTHQTTKFSSYDGVIVVPGIGRMHHLLIFTPGETTKLQVYTDQLEWHAETVLPLKLYHTSHVTVLPLQNDYFIYNRSAQQSLGLWRIDALGKVYDETLKLMKIKEEFFADTSANIQMYTHDNRMYMVSNMYRQPAHKIVTTILPLNSLLEPGSIEEYTCDYDHRRENLQSITLVPERDLILMKRQAVSAGKYLLQIVKIKLQTKKVYKANYTNRLPFLSPTMVYNTNDSSLIVYSRNRVKHPLYADTLNDDVFYTTANDTLASLFPSTTTSVKLPTKLYPYFLGFSSGNGFTHWLTLRGKWSYTDLGITKNGLLTIVSPHGKFLNASSYNPVMQPIDPYLQHAAYPENVRFIVIDKHFNIGHDTTVKHVRKNFIEVNQYATFSNENKSYLLLKEQFHSRGKGLLLMSGSAEGKLIAEPLHPYERYHYSLPQMQRTSKGNILIPYISKGKVGLVEINLSKP